MSSGPRSVNEIARFGRSPERRQSWSRHGAERGGSRSTIRAPAGGTVAPTLTLREMGDRMLARTTTWLACLALAACGGGSSSGGGAVDPTTGTITIRNASTHGFDRVYAEQGKVHVNDLHATLLAILGLDHERLTFRHAGRDFRLTDVAGNVVNEILS